MKTRKHLGYTEFKNEIELGTKLSDLFKTYELKHNIKGEVMKEEDKIELARKVSPFLASSTDEIVDMIDELIYLQKSGCFRDFKIDERCIFKFINFKLKTGIL